MDISKAISDISLLESRIVPSKDDIVKALQGSVSNFNKFFALPEEEQRMIWLEMLRDYVKDKYPEEYKRLEVKQNERK